MTQVDTYPNILAHFYRILPAGAASGERELAQDQACTLHLVVTGAGFTHI